MTRQYTVYIIQYIHVCVSRMAMIIRRITLILNAIFCATATKELIQNGGFEDGTNGWGSMGETFFLLMYLDKMLSYNYFINQDVTSQ